MKRSPLRRRSKHAERRAREAKPIRDQLIAEAGNVCMACGHGPSNPRRDMPPACSSIACHEILNGPLRLKTLDIPSTILVLCWICNSSLFNRKQLWPASKQLALLKIRSPERFDLEEFNRVRNENSPNFVTAEEVEEWIPILLKNLPTGTL